MGQQEEKAHPASLIAYMDSSALKKKTSKMTTNNSKAEQPMENYPFIVIFYIISHFSPEKLNEICSLMAVLEL